eukprot:94002-Pleurochrysis_carterae.AAC.2
MERVSVARRCEWCFAMCRASAANHTPSVGSKGTQGCSKSKREAGCLQSSRRTRRSCCLVRLCLEMLLRSFNSHKLAIGMSRGVSVHVSLLGVSTVSATSCNVELMHFAPRSDKVLLIPTTAACNFLDLLRAISGIYCGIQANAEALSFHTRGGALTGNGAADCGVEAKISCSSFSSESTLDWLQLELGRDPEGTSIHRPARVSCCQRHFCASGSIQNECKRHAEPSCAVAAGMLALIALYTTLLILSSVPGWLETSRLRDSCKVCPIA